MMEELIASSIRITTVSPEAAEAYSEAIPLLLLSVNTQLESNPKIKDLIGRNPFELMRENHAHHALFMTTVFKLNSFELLVRTVPWVYSAYHARGFSYDYFPAELVAWQVALHQNITNPAHRVEIRAVYSWMVTQHEAMIKLSQSVSGLSFSVQHETDELLNVFLSQLLSGDSRGCLKLVDQSVHSAEDLKRFYLAVVWPALYRIGYLWESNKISVAEEHLATAIVGRVMAAMYQRVVMSPITKGKVVVSAGPNEFHEVGARMVADFLEMSGWDVTFLGANTPAVDLLGFLKKELPFAVVFSVATVFNLDKARQLIVMINEAEETRHIKVMVGGLAFNNMPELWQNIGADGHAADAEGAVRLCDEWWSGRNHDDIE